MKKPPLELQRRTYKLHRSSLSKYISRLPTPVDFRIHDWLQTLRTRQLRCIEQDAKICADSDIYPTLPGPAAVDLGAIALMAYTTENCSEDIPEDDIDCLDGLLIGLAVAACVERLKRIGWVTVTSRMSIVLRDPRPYRVTQKGLDEGFWSDDPMILWILGADLQIH
jgi:hypothetical protein